jgi:hypothetical protein
MSDGAAATNGMVVLVPANASGRPAVAMQQGGAGNRIDQTGAFRVTNVAPGRYQVQARAGGREFELARLDLSVGTDDVEGLTLVTAPGSVINGTVVSDTGEPFDFPRPATANRVAARIARHPGDGGRRRHGQRARRRRLVLHAAQRGRRGDRPRPAAAGLGDEVGVRQRPGDHRHAD